MMSGKEAVTDDVPVRMMQDVMVELENSVESVKVPLLDAVEEG